MELINNGNQKQENYIRKLNYVIEFINTNTKLTSAKNRIIELILKDKFWIDKLKETQENKTASLSNELEKTNSTKNWHKQKKEHNIYKRK